MSPSLIAPNNSWWEIQVIAEQSLEEQIFWRLQNFGCQGMASQKKDGQISVSSYLPVEKSSVLDLAALALRLMKIGHRAGNNIGVHRKLAICW
jgi:ribosomal protein L11 methyltransferase